VLVAHSLGGLYAVAYTQQFRSDVAGLVLVDALHADSTTRMAAAGLQLPLPRWPVRIASVLGRLGLLRLLGPEGDPEAAYAPASFSATLDELNAVEQSQTQAGALRQLGPRPLYVLGSGRVSEEFLAEGGLTPEQGAQFLAV